MAITHKLLGAAATVLSLACTAAYADSTPLSQSPQEVVRFDHLNLDQPRDVAQLFSRISWAAARVCGPRSYGGDVNKTAEYDSCYSDAIARAVARIDRPSLTAYFRERSGESRSSKLAMVQQ